MENLKEMGSSCGKKKVELSMKINEAEIHMLKQKLEMCEEEKT